MIAVIAVLAVVALLLVWLSLSMAATEGAVGRVTRASLNNLILEVCHCRIVCVLPYLLQCA